jgi:hypothetical protein
MGLGVMRPVDDLAAALSCGTCRSGNYDPLAETGNSGLCTFRF